MFDQMIKQLQEGTPRTSENWHNKPTDPQPSPKSIPVQMRDILTGEILVFPNFSAAADHFRMTDRRFIRALVDNPTRTWRNYQAKYYSDDSPWDEPSPDTLPVLKSQNGRRLMVFVVTLYTPGGNQPHICAGYREAAKLTGKSETWLAKRVCYNIDSRGAKFSIRHATMEDLANFPEFDYCPKTMRVRFLTEPTSETTKTA